MCVCVRERDVCVYVIVCVSHTSAHLTWHCFLMNYAYANISADGQKLCLKF